MSRERDTMGIRGTSLRPFLRPPSLKFSWPAKSKKEAPRKDGEKARDMRVIKHPATLPLPPPKCWLHLSPDAMADMTFGNNCSITSSTTTSSPSLALTGVSWKEEIDVGKRRGREFPLRGWRRRGRRTTAFIHRPFRRQQKSE